MANHKTGDMVIMAAFPDGTDGIHWCPQMAECVGKEGMIKAVHRGYSIEGWSWSIGHIDEANPIPHYEIF